MVWRRRSGIVIPLPRPREPIAVVRGATPGGDFRGGGAGEASGVTEKGVAGDGRQPFQENGISFQTLEGLRIPARVGQQVWLREEGVPSTPSLDGLMQTIRDSRAQDRNS